MPNAFLTGIKNLRSSLLTGALLLSSIYILALGNGIPSIELRPSAQYILNLHERMVLVLIVIAAYLTGSVYTTALEGMVDWIHRKLLYTSVAGCEHRLRREMISVFGPLSDSSRNRLQLEAGRFYAEVTGGNEVVDDLESSEVFVRKVIADVLWMEGKLTGTPLRETYADYRTEGEFRLGVGLLLPLVAGAAAYAILLNWLLFTAILLTTIALSLLTCNYGLYYFRRAHSLLAHHVSDGALLTPSMETLKRTLSMDQSI